jgi:hypothetical protein
MIFITYVTLSFEHKRETTEMCIDQSAGSGVNGDETLRHDVPSQKQLV